MFESIIFFRQNKTNFDKPIDIGSLVECMLFYERTIITVDKPILKQLLTYFGINRIIELINEGLLQIIYTETNVGILTKEINGIEHHGIVKFSSPNPLERYQLTIRDICIDVEGKIGRGRRLAQRIEKLIKKTDYETILLEGTKKSILDQEYINNSAKIILQSYIPEQINVDGLMFHTEETTNGNGIIVYTNINFQTINQIYHKYIPPTHSAITPAFILEKTLVAESELYLSSNNLSEISTSDLSVNLISYRVNYLLEKSVKSSNEISNFQNYVFNDARSLREAVNNNKVNLDDLVSVLKKSQKFKHWISGVKPERDLLKNYLDEISKKTFIEKLPFRVAKWCIFIGIGDYIDKTWGTEFAGKVAGLGFSAFEEFYLDKLIKGWKPNQFIEEVANELLDNKNS